MKGIITLIGKIQIYLMFHIFICFDDDDDDVSAHSLIDYNTNQHEKLHCFYLDTYFESLLLSCSYYRDTVDHRLYFHSSVMCHKCIKHGQSVHVYA